MGQNETFAHVILPCHVYYGWNILLHPTDIRLGPKPCFGPWNGHRSVNVSCRHWRWENSCVSLYAPWDSGPFHEISVPCAPGGNHRGQTSIVFKSEVQLNPPMASSEQQNLSRFIDSWVWNKILCCELWGIRECLLQNTVTATAE